MTTEMQTLEEGECDHPWQPGGLGGCVWPGDCLKDRGRSTISCNDTDDTSLINSATNRYLYWDHTASRNLVLSLLSLQTHLWTWAAEVCSTLGILKRLKLCCILFAGVR